MGNSPEPTGKECNLANIDLQMETKDTLAFVFLTDHAKCDFSTRSYFWWVDKLNISCYLL